MAELARILAEGSAPRPVHVDSATLVDPQARAFVHCTDQMTSVSPLERPAKVCEAGRPICPKCGKPIRRLTMGAGSAYATCENSIAMRAPNNGPIRTDKCGQHVHLHGTSEGIVIVVAITPAEFQALVAGAYQPAAAVYAQLGVTKRAV